jgi:phenylacetate-CoA ligase
MNMRKSITTILLKVTGSNVPKYLKKIQKLDKLSNKKLKEYQEEKLKKLLIHAYKNVPYCTRILKDSGVVASGKVNLKNFCKIPILTKEIIRKEKENLYSKDHEKRKSYENTSGGSTGEPVKFLQDKEYSDWNIANKMFYKAKAGQKVGDRELRFWGSERDLLEGKESAKIRLRNRIYNRKEFNTFKMSEKEMLDYVDKWNKYKPTWVESYVQSIYEFAKFVEKKELKIYSPKNGILTSAGTLFPEMKKTISRVFNCPVYNRYGSREVGDMACGKDTLKLSLWNHQFETGKKGEVYVTTLNNYSMPLIRYNIGDVVKMENDSEIMSVKGRVNHMIKTSKGNIDSAAITSALYFDLKGKLLTSFSKYQLIQRKKNEFELKIIVSDKTKWQSEKIMIKKVLNEILGIKSQINFNEVKTIKSLKNGKYEYIRSELCGV